MLPFAEPLYSTYHCFANAGIPAKQNNSSDNWYFNHTAEWYCTRKFLHGFTSPEISISSGTVWHMPFLDVKSLDTQFIRKCVVEVIKAMLDDGFYVLFSEIDDYYIEGKTWYNEKHFYHDGLILGYDDDNQTFSIAAYNQRWIYGVFETSQKCFKEAVNIGYEKGVCGKICAVKSNEIIEELKPQEVYNNVNHYLLSTIEEYPLDDEGNVWGIVVFDFICMYLDMLLDGSIPYDRKDRRIIRMIWEHKKCMLKRIEAIEKQFSWDKSISSQYDEVVVLLDKARFIYTKFSMKFSGKHLEDVQRILIRVKDLETAILSNFIKELGNEL